MNTQQAGPVAPRDPEKKRSGFYVMRGKSIAGSPTPDGRGIQFIYESDGRLQSSARLMGNVTDEDMLNMMSTVKGFRQLVHSIGVSVSAEDYRDSVRFAFQMYGHTDPYVSGTTMEMDIPADGMEYVLFLEDVNWSEDDNVPGQIRFEFSKAGVGAEASVIFYLNDGYTAPEQTEDSPVDVTSKTYKDIIAKSLIQKGNTARLAKAINKARNGEEVTISFIGGSITQGAGAIPINTECYARKTFEGFCKLVGKGTDENIHYVKAGIGGTPSELGMIRYQRDVVDEGTPDIVVIEFAVNDEGDETKGDCYDSLARKVYNGPGKPAVILLYAVFANDWNLEERLCCVGEAYDLPMVSTRRSVVDQFYLTPDTGRVLSKSQFFYDMFHPTNLGHTIMADGIINLLTIVDQDMKAGKADTQEVDISEILPPKSGDFEEVMLLDRKDMPCEAVINAGSFTETDADLQAVERNMDLGHTPTFPNNWMYKGAEGKEPEAFTIDVTCKRMLIIFKDSASAGVGTADVFVDGEKRLTFDPHMVGWTHPTPVIAIRERESKKHHVEIKISEGMEGKDFTILGFGIVE